MQSAINSPKGIWWKPIHRQEKRWLQASFIWCMVLFAMMPLWIIKGGQNPSGVRTYMKPADFERVTNQFVADYKIGEERGFPVVAPPPGADIYMLGRMWSWYPVLKLEEGVTYTLHLSSMDLNHGFSLYPVKINFMVLPNYDYALKVTPNASGEFKVICNEFCGIGHHFMVGKVIVNKKNSVEINKEKA